MAPICIVALPSMKMGHKWHHTTSQDGIRRLGRPAEDLCLPMHLGRTFGSDIWARLLGPTFGPDFWARLLGPTFGPDFWECKGAANLCQRTVSYANSWRDRLLVVSATVRQVPVLGTETALWPWRSGVPRFDNGKGRQYIRVLPNWTGGMPHAAAHAVLELPGLFARPHQKAVNGAAGPPSADQNALTRFS